MTPATVDVAGGTVVTITGTALPANPRVRVGDSATAAVVVTSSSTSLTFRAPARVAGVYDVHVFAPDGTESVLTRRLTYVDGAPAAGAPGPAPRAPGPGPGPEHRRLGHRDRRVRDRHPGTGGRGDRHGHRARASGPGAPGQRRLGLRLARVARAPVVATGPGGERLVRTTKFAALGAIWSMDCSTSCSGVAI